MGVCAIIVSIVSVAVVSTVKESAIETESAVMFFFSEQPIEEKHITLINNVSIIKTTLLFIYIVQALPFLKFLAKVQLYFYIFLILS